MNKKKLNFEEDALKSIIVDFIFTFLPLIVLVFIIIFTLKFENIFVRSDFSYISMILFGQTIIKLFSGISENENKKRTVKLVLDMSLIISLGLVPSISVTEDFSVTTAGSSHFVRRCLANHASLSLKASCNTLDRLKPD